MSSRIVSKKPIIFSDSLAGICSSSTVLFKFTHTSEIDWMLPGVKPTGRRVEIPLIVIVRFVDGRVAHEHIYWDQASVLVQVGLLDPEGLPVAGIETARKAVDQTLPSNELMSRWAASSRKPI
jgi:carboxymethylenebutenolidase